ncbi:hypothetical protein RhiirA5_410779 [Rhizophagus irregularis]|uniref:Uncharacterized protein n=1 Tax=Rhizophagus irregularis TaxID=588596 RepID=A0A2N0Q2R9_9GLOM|nr:hypothetical protein RhiirA5_410779 [Rhizophagus irregularis]
MVYEVYEFPLLVHGQFLDFLNEEDLPDHTINTFMKEFVNTCQYTEYPNKRPPILRANSYRKYLYAKIKRVGDTIIGVATQYYFDSADISHPDPGGSNHPSSVVL